MTKTFPPFKPHFTEVAPESTSDKSDKVRSSHVRLQSSSSGDFKLNQGLDDLQGQEKSGDASSSVASSGAATSGDITSSGKFTTANFHEAPVTTLAASSIFMSEKRKAQQQVRKTGAASSSQPHSSKPEKDAASALPALTAAARKAERPDKNKTDAISTPVKKEPAPAGTEQGVAGT